MPLELLSFSGRAANDNNILHWTTATEINNAYFSLQISSTGNHFENIATIAGAVTSNQKNNYSYTDSKPREERSYYRLKQTDFDGNSSYSKTIVLENVKTNQEIKVIYSSSDNQVKFFFIITKMILSWKFSI